MSTTEWTFDPSHSTVGFTVRHLMVTKVHGRFHKWSGQLVIDDTDITKSTVNVAIETASVDTKEEKRDAHLASPDFFNSEKYPRMTFKGTRIEKKGNDLLVTGELFLNGVTKTIALEVELTDTVKDPWGGTRRGFEAKGSISRKDFGLTWNAALETGGVVVGDEVKINLDIQAIKAAALAA
ncbi:MAG TPA: YceI family protein [Kofleriaceae bacterium]|jgi:polyisoprenoid-binding protein YceI